jgi:hypothetical protein
MGDDEEVSGVDCVNECIDERTPQEAGLKSGMRVVCPGVLSLSWTCPRRLFVVVKVGHN